MTNQGSAERVKRRRAGERVYVVSSDVVSLLFVYGVICVVVSLFHQQSVWQTPYQYYKYGRSRKTGGQRRLSLCSVSDYLG